MAKHRALTKVNTDTKTVVQSTLHHNDEEHVKVLEMLDEIKKDTGLKRGPATVYILLEVMRAGGVQTLKALKKD